MEENNKQQPEQDMQEPVNEEIKEHGTPLRSSIIMLLAGVYLLYTGYKLCQDVLNGTNGSNWGFFAAGVGFLIVGVVMLVVGCRDLIKREKAKQAAEAAKPEQKPEEVPEQKKTMSIAERAHLADGLDEENTEENSEETAESTVFDKESDHEEQE